MKTINVTSLPACAMVKTDIDRINRRLALLGTVNTLDTSKLTETYMRMLGRRGSLLAYCKK